MAKTKKISVVLDVPAGKSCGASWPQMCRFLLLTKHGSLYRQKRIHCVLFDKDIQLSGRFYVKCDECVKKIRVGVL
jgi:hypothetical protein